MWIIIGLIIVGLGIAIMAWLDFVEPRVAGGVFTNGDAYEKRQAEKAEKERIKTTWRIQFERHTNDPNYLTWLVYAPGKSNRHDYAKLGVVAINNYYGKGTLEDALERAEKEAKDWITAEKKRRAPAKGPDPLGKTIYVKGN